MAGDRRQEPSYVRTPDCSGVTAGLLVAGDGECRVFGSRLFGDRLGVVARVAEDAIAAGGLRAVQRGIGVAEQRFRQCRFRRPRPRRR